MGIAAGDLNGDSRIDLFIGNFLKETNTLYLHEEGGSFADATREYALEQPSFDLLAFGTQFIDGDLDGDLDLMVTNGHVDDVRAYGRPYHMRPQFFQNPGSGPLVEHADRCRTIGTNHRPERDKKTGHPFELLRWLVRSHTRGHSQMGLGWGSLG